MRGSILPMYQCVHPWRMFAVLYTSYLAPSLPAEQSSEPCHIPFFSPLLGRLHLRPPCMTSTVKASLLTPPYSKAFPPGTTEEMTPLRTAYCCCCVTYRHGVFPLSLVFFCATATSGREKRYGDRLLYPRIVAADTGRSQRHGIQDDDPNPIPVYSTGVGW